MVRLCGLDPDSGRAEERLHGTNKQLYVTFIVVHIISLFCMD
jgi:hypothetical protein